LSNNKALSMLGELFYSNDLEFNKSLLIVFLEIARRNNFLKSMSQIKLEMVLNNQQVIKNGVICEN